MINAQWGPLTYYQTLGAFETASQEEIKHAYRQLAKKYHPDHNRSKSAEAKFKEINEAYQTLGDPGRRQVYDYDLRQSRKASAAGSSPAGSSSSPPPSGTGTSGSAPSGTQPPPSTPPPPASNAYRYLFFFRGVLVGGVAVGAVLAVLLASYTACRKSSVGLAASVPRREVAVNWRAEPPAPVSVPPTAIPTEAPAEIATVILEPTPTEPESMAAPEPAAPLPLVTEPAPIPTPSAIQVTGRWRGSLEDNGTKVNFVVQLEQRGNEIKGIWTEHDADSTRRVTVSGRVKNSTVVLELLYPKGRCLARFFSDDSSSNLLSGTWSCNGSEGSWQASPEPIDRNESWRLR